MADSSGGADEPPKRSRLETADATSKRSRVGDTLTALAARLRCSITGELLVDPVVTTDGQVYERAAIESWLAGHDTSPMSGAQLSGKTLVPCSLALGSVSDLVEADFLSAQERQDWFVKRGSMLQSSNASSAKTHFEKAIRLGSATAKYRLGCLLILEAAAEGFPEAQRHPVAAATAAVKKAHVMKEAGHSALEAKEAGCPGTEIYALCSEFRIGRLGEIQNVEGTQCVTVDGRFGTMASRDGDKSAPWIVKGVSTEEWSSDWELVKRVRPLCWA